MTLQALRIFFLASLTVLLSTSVAAGPGPDVDWQNGAKRGWIVGIITAGDPPAGLPACLVSIAGPAHTSRPFVKVRYWHVRQMFTAVAELPQATSAVVGQQVELWPQDCARGKLSRISRVLAGDT